MVLETPYAPSQPIASERLRTADCVSAGKIPIVPVWLHGTPISPQGQKMRPKRSARRTQYRGPQMERSVLRLTATDVNLRFFGSR